MRIAELVSKLDYHFNTMSGEVITDPEKLPLYKKSGKATVVACQEGTLTLGGSVRLAFAEDVAATSADRWKLTFSSKSVAVSAITGTMLTFR